MAYLIDDRTKDSEKWRVFIKFKNFAGKRMDDKLGVEIGITEPKNFIEAVQTENILKNVKITLSANEKNRNFYEKTELIDTELITLNMLGEDTNKVLIVVGYFNRYLSDSITKYVIENGNGKKPTYELNINIFKDIV